MEDILLVIMMLAIFVFGYYVVDRFGRFMDENLREYQGPEEPSGRVFTAETKDKGTKNTSKEINTMSDSIKDDKYSLRQ